MIERNHEDTKTRRYEEDKTVNPSSFAFLQ